MKDQYLLRSIAAGCGVLLILKSTIENIMSYSWSFYYWIWGMPILVINTLNLYFLYKSLRQKPKQIDSRWSSFLISTGAALALGVTSFFTSYPLLELPYITTLSHIGVVISLFPYPFAIWAILSLNNCLTVLPEAHALVVRGIYKFSRHPLYMCYIVWAISSMLVFPSWPVIVLSITEIILQLLRLKREEALLLEALPEYKNYREQTGLIGRWVNY
jgi:protein-S-isoprenylcysteine O-methyltransferase Ste14